MNLFNKLTVVATSLMLSVTALVIATSASASADCYQYNANGFNTSSTPVFNNICGVPEGINNESDFVRIRANVNGNDEDNTNNPAYTVGTLSSTCTPGTKYDVWNYLHNDASANDNPGTGSGSAVANGVSSDMTAPVGTTNSSFTFGDTVTSTNAANSGIHDSAVLNCQGKQVQLSVVAQSIHMYSTSYGNNWLSPSGLALNTPVSLGSTNGGAASALSGTQWGCWNYRIVVVYQVQVTAIPAPVTQTPPVCSALSAIAENQGVDITKIGYNAGSASVTSTTLDFGAGSTKTFTPSESAAITTAAPYVYSYSAPGAHMITATINTTYNGKQDNVTSKECSVVVTTASVPPASTTPTTTPTATTASVTPMAVTAPKTLVNTGPGSAIGIFAAASAVGAIAYRWFIGRRMYRS